MKTQRTLASFCLAVSCCALVVATNVSVGDQPGVVRLTSGQDTFDPPAPVPPAPGDGASATIAPNSAPPPMPQPDYSVPPATVNGPAPIYSQSMPMDQGPPPAFGPQPMDYSPYFEQSAGVTESPVIGRRPVDNPLFGPQLMFESNIGEGLGYGESFHRVNARIPYHVVPGNSVLSADLSASISDDNRNLYNLGAYWRNYDAMRNRIFGWNAYWDMDDGRGNKQWNRLGVGVESLGKYVDFRLNGYLVQGEESFLLSDRLIGDLAQSGTTVTRIRNQSRENAYSGVDVEIGGPIPLLGRRGMNLYTGAYWLDSEYGYETAGFSARFQALITESATVNVTLTNDDTFGTNSWVSVSYSLPNYGERTILQPKAVRDRLADPVQRSRRVHSNLDVVNVPEAIVNAKTGLAWNLRYVDPNATAAGLGTFESPWNTLQAAVDNNDAAIDVIQLTPREDDTGTNLTATGGFNLFECQALVSSIKDYTLFSEAGQDFVLPGTATVTGLGPLVSDPAMLAGGSVIGITNGNTVSGLRIDAANAAGTVFGTGISNALPLTDARIICNTFTNYVTAVDIQDGSGTIIFDENTTDGLAGASEQGLVLTTANGSTTDLLIRNNTVDDNSVRGVSVTANPNATINADDPNGAKGQITGIVNNTVTNGGQGIEVIGLAGSTVNLVATDNTSTGNTFNGFIARTDSGLFNLRSLSRNAFNSNLENGAFLHYLGTGIMDARSEDLNGNGEIDPGEDTNGNGILDEGIVSNTMSRNSAAGLCIFGQNGGVGEFDIGGPVATLGNIFTGNTAAGVAVDLQNDATAQIDALFNTIQGGPSNPGVTIVLDFIDPGQGSVVDVFGRTVNPFDVSLYGFQPAQFDVVTGAIADTIESYFRNVPTMGQDARSPIPDDMELDVDFVIGDTGVAPSNGATEYYVMTIGDSAANLGGLAGQAADIGNIRNAQGQGPGQGLTGFPQTIGASSMAVYTNQINQFSPLLTPPDAFIGPAVPDPIIVEDPSQTPQFAINALTSGNLTFTRRAIGLVAAHELGHTVSLRHINQTGRTTPTGLNAIMGTPAIDSPLQSLLEPAEFAFDGTNPGELPGEAPFQQNSIAQLATALGVRVAAGETREGISIRGTGNSRLLNTTIINNTINSAAQHGVNVTMADTARAEPLTIQGNTITNGAGNGIQLVADQNAFIDAANTIGGSGTNTLRNAVFSQSNIITNNAGDGVRVLASNGGEIHGNLISNEISSNGGNGVSMYVENGGVIDFGTAANRIITGNNITDNGGIGIELISNVSAATQGRIDAVIQGNTISRNAGGGIVSSMTGPNMLGMTNNEINLTVGGTTTQANTIADNGNVGVGFSVAGNGKGTFSITNSTISGTTDGTDPLTFGDGIYLSRADSSLLLADIADTTSINNAGNGMLIEVQGNDKNDPNQPMTGMVNTVDWNTSVFDENGLNGVAIRTRGDAMLFADGQSNFTRNNAIQGIDIETTENSSFGDSTDGPPPGRRVIFDGLTSTGNGVDGVWATASEGSQLLLEITSNRVAGSSGAHAALNTNGDTNISNNGTDGVHIDAFDNATVDVKITAETPITPTSGKTYIQNNGTNGGASGGIFVAATGNGTGVVNVVNTVISGTQAFSTEDLDGNGILDAGEDLNGNGDIDVVGGDGISYNAFNQSDLALIVGGVGEGNMIQNNADDGIAITAVGQGTDISRPIITIIENTIGGENNGVAAGNGGDGVSLNITGGTADVTSIGSDPGSIDTDIGDGDGLSSSNGLTESGPIVQLTLRDNLVSNNSQRGVNLLLNGAAGERNREFGAALFDPVRITMTGNTIVSNGTEGVFFRGDSDMNQGRLTYLANFPFPDPPFNPANNRPRFFALYDPLQAEFQADNVGSVNGNSAFGALAPDSEAGFLNLRTVQNTLFTMTGNTVQNNGTGTVTGEGLVLSVGTGAYLAADVRGNTFGGNLEEDVRTESFLSFGNTFDSVDDAGGTNFDAIYHDDTAQLDMRFSNNSGNQISITSVGATYTNRDSLKEIHLGFTPTNLSGVTERDAGLFQIDDGGNLDNPNNTFINFGITQDIDGEFSSGLFNLRAGPDAAFPNIGFAPFLP